MSSSASSCGPCARSASRRHAGACWSSSSLLGNPLTLKALEVGHPEELLGAALCVGAVLAALWQRPWLAAVLLGLALANKAWAVLAIGPVLLALQGRRWTVFALACAIAAMFVAPFLLSGSSRGSVLSAGGTDAVSNRGRSGGRSATTATR